MYIPVQSHESLVTLIGHFHSLDEYGRERADMLDKASSVAFDCVIVYEADEPSYGRYESESLKGGRRVTGTLKDTEHKFTVDLPAEMNDAVQEMMPNDEFQTTLIIEKWDTVYERFGAVVATGESQDKAGKTAGPETIEETRTAEPSSDSQLHTTADTHAPAEHPNQPITKPSTEQAPQTEQANSNTASKGASNDAKSQPSSKLRAEQTSAQEWEDPTAGVKRTAFDVEQGVGDGYEGDSDKLATFAVTGLIAIILVGGIIAYLLYSSLKD
ncbi:MAG: hypothetical protein ACJZ8O_12250 [Pirellulaceae bacterium]